MSSQKGQMIKVMSSS